MRGTEATEYLDGLRRTFNYYIYNDRIDPSWVGLGVPVAAIVWYAMPGPASSRGE